MAGVIHFGLESATSDIRLDDGAAFKLVVRILKFNLVVEVLGLQELSFHLIKKEVGSFIRPFIFQKLCG